MIDWSKYPNFSEDEFRCKGTHCCGGKALMDEYFLALLQQLRTEVGFPFHITSGYRCPDHNAAVSRTGRAGPHTTGQAADIAVNGPQRYKILAEFAKYGFTGVGIANTFIHLDLLSPDEAPRPTSWTY